MDHFSQSLPTFPVRTNTHGTRLYRFCRNCFLVVFLGVLFAQPGYSQISTYKIQAIFLYNFTKYVNWPQPGNTIVIGVVGDSDLMVELNTNLKGKKAGTKTFDIRQLKSTEEAAQCNLVYLPSVRSKELKDLMNIVKGKGVLIVTEEDLADQGAGISFLQVEQKLRFKINSKVLKEAGLQASSGLLGLAIVI